MFGYVKPVPAELLVRDYEFYKATYCGICRRMKTLTGALSPAALTYDSVFLALIRMIFEPDEVFSVKKRRCAVHPIKKRGILDPNGAIDFTVRVFALLTYFKGKDDSDDEKGAKKIALTAAMPVLSGAKRKAGDLSPLSDVIRNDLLKIRELEAARCGSVDALAEPFGHLLGEVFAFGLADENAVVLRELGFRLGKFIYAADAAEDYADDVRRGRFNPYAVSYGSKPLTDENRANIRTALLLECRGMEAAVNLLPFGNRSTLERLIRNIIDLGLPARIGFLSGSDVGM